MNLSKGDYVLFVDSDDWIDHDILQKLYDEVKDTHVDILITDYWQEFHERSEYVCQRPKSLKNDDIVLGMCSYLMGSLWNKLIRRELFYKYNIRFESHLRYCEDWVTIYKLLQNPVKVGYSNIAFYHYDQYSNANSLARTINADTYKNRLAFIDVVEQLGMPEKYPDGYRRLLSNLAYIGIRSDYYSSKEFKARYAGLDVWNSGLQMPKRIVVITALHSRLIIAKMVDNMFRNINRILIAIRN